MADQAGDASPCTGGRAISAVVFTCCDLEIDPAELFSDRRGELLVVRSVGLSCRNEGLAGVEFGVSERHAAVVVVLGHRHCCAFDAEPPGGCPSMADALGRVRGVAVPSAIGTGAAGDDEEDARQEAPARWRWIEGLVGQTIRELIEGSPALRERVAAGSLKIVGAVADDDTRQVHWLGPHPQQSQLLAQGVPARRHSGRLALLSQILAEVARSDSEELVWALGQINQVLDELDGALSRDPADETAPAVIHVDPALWGRS